MSLKYSAAAKLKFDLESNRNCFSCTYVVPLWMDNVSHCELSNGNTWYYRVVCHSDNSIFVHQEIYSMSDWVSIDMGDHLWVYHLVM